MWWPGQVMRRIAFLCTFSALPFLLIVLGGGASAAGPDPFVGSFSGDRLQVEIALDPSPQRPGYIGTFHFGGRQFPFTATRSADQIVGKFKSGKDAFEFSATLAGSGLTFETGGTTYRLMQLSPAPAAHPPAP